MAYFCFPAFCHNFLHEELEIFSSKKGGFLYSDVTIMEHVFYHDLLITKLYHIDYKKHTGNIHDSKDMLLGF